VPEPNAFEFAMVIEKLNRHKSPGIIQMPAEFITAGGRKIGSYPLIINSKTDFSVYSGISRLSNI
jgi:hypothetical protein